MRAITVSEVVYLNMMVSSPTIVIHERQLTRVVAKLKNQLKLHNMNQHMLMCCCCLNHIYTLVCRSLTEMSTKNQLHMWNFDWNFSQISTLVCRILVETSTKFRPHHVATSTLLNSNFDTLFCTIYTVKHQVQQQTSTLAGGRSFDWWGSKFRHHGVEIWSKFQPNFDPLVLNFGWNYNFSKMRGRSFVEISTKF